MILLVILILLIFICILILDANLLYFILVKLAFPAVFLCFFIAPDLCLIGSAIVHQDLTGLTLRMLG